MLVTGLQTHAKITFRLDTTLAHPLLSVYVAPVESSLVIVIITMDKHRGDSLWSGKVCIRNSISGEMDPIIPFSQMGKLRPERRRPANAEQAGSTPAPAAVPFPLRRRHLGGRGAPMPILAQAARSLSPSRPSAQRLGCLFPFFSHKAPGAQRRLPRPAFLARLAGGCGGSRSWAARRGPPAPPAPGSPCSMLR